jgi:hypothetical protein
MNVDKDRHNAIPDHEVVPTAVDPDKKRLWLLTSLTSRCLSV